VHILQKSFPTKKPVQQVNLQARIDNKDFNKFVYDLEIAEE
jgi:hypothetical protein